MPRGIIYSKCIITIKKRNVNDTIIQTQELAHSRPNNCAGFLPSTSQSDSKPILSKNDNTKYFIPLLPQRSSIFCVDLYKPQLQIVSYLRMISLCTHCTVTAVYTSTLLPRIIFLAKLSGVVWGHVTTTWCCPAIIFGNSPFPNEFFPSHLHCWWRKLLLRIIAFVVTARISFPHCMRIPP